MRGVLDMGVKGLREPFSLRSQSGWRLVIVSLSNFYDHD